MSDTTAKPATMAIWVEAAMEPILKKTKVQVKVGTKTVVRKTGGMFNKTAEEYEEPIFENQEKWVPSGKHSDCRIDLDKFTEDLNGAFRTLDEAGYDVAQVIPLNSGRYNFQYASIGTIKEITTDGGYGYGYGYDITDRAIVVGRLRGA